MSFFSGIVDERDHIRLGGYPAPFKELLGLQIEDFVPMATGETNRLDTTDGETCDLWADLIHLQGAESLASYTDDFYAGTPAVTRNVFGEGAAYYLGTRPEERYTRSLLQRAWEEAGVRPTAEVRLVSTPCVARPKPHPSSSCSTTTRRPWRSGYRTLDGISSRERSTIPNWSSILSKSRY